MKAALWLVHPAEDRPMLQRKTTTKIIVFCLAGFFGVARLSGDRQEDDQARSLFGGKTVDDPVGVSVVFQDKANNCGAAALKMMLEHFGCTMSLRDVERKLVLSPRGTSMERLREIADEVGVQLSGWKLRREDLGQIRFPIIMFLKKNHFVVADSLDASGYLFVRDPAIGSIRMSQHTLPGIWGGEALVFSDTHDAKRKQRKLRERE